jgi:hypothetical protein
MEGTVPSEAFVAAHRVHGPGLTSGVQQGPVVGMMDPNADYPPSQDQVHTARLAGDA